MSMKKFRIKWCIQRDIVVWARDQKHAEKIAEEVNCEVSGEYVDDSFELLDVYLVKKGSWEDSILARTEKLIPPV